MKHLLLAAGMALALTAAAQTDTVCNTIQILPTDTHAAIIGKAVRVVPTPNQLAAMQDEFIAFVHFGLNTFTRREWGNGKEDPKVFALRALDTDQWCAAIKAAGMKKVIFTAKHHDGFVLWQSRYTRHGIMSTGFRDGQGDVLRDLAASCRKYGLKLGIYLSPADLYQIEHPDGLYGNLSAYTRRTVPREVPGRPFVDKRRFSFVVDDYNEYFLNQLFELLTEYGPVDEVWFDGAHPKRKGGQRYNYAAWRELIRTLAPQAVIFGREDVRWCGNEAGGTRQTEWNVVPYAADPDTMTVFADMTATDLGSREQLYKAAYLHYQPAETNTSIREGWFYRDDDRQQVRSADDVFDIYERAVGGNSIFLLNIPPNREGRFSPADVATLEETGRRVRDTYGGNLLGGADAPGALLDADLTTAVGIDTLRPELVITLTQPVTANRFVIQEAVGTSGERVEAHALDVWTGSAWKEVARATNIGYKRILRFPDVTTGKFRVRFLVWRTAPQIAGVAAHRYAAHPPHLSAVRTRDGRVSIAPAVQRFGWKSSGEDPAANLSAGYKIYYTTDGTVPGADARPYDGSVRVGNTELKAVARLGDEQGPVLAVRYGLIKQDWQIASAGSEAEGHAATAAIDEHPDTYWCSVPGKGQELTVDLGREYALKGFAYTPPQHGGRGMIERGTVMVSRDGKKWKRAADFEFGNLVNDPTRRFHDFAKTAKARYVRIVPVRIAADAGVAAIAELDFF